MATPMIPPDVLAEAQARAASVFAEAFAGSGPMRPGQAVALPPALRAAVEAACHVVAVNAAAEGVRAMMDEVTASWLARQVGAG